MRQAQCEERVWQWFASNGYTMLPKELLGWEVIAQKDDDMWLVEVRGEELNAMSNEGDFERMVGQIAARIDQFDETTIMYLTQSRFGATMRQSTLRRCLHARRVWQTEREGTSCCRAVVPGSLDANVSLPHFRTQRLGYRKIRSAGSNSFTDPHVSISPRILPRLRLHNLLQPCTDGPMARRAKITWPKNQKYPSLKGAAGILQRVPRLEFVMRSAR